MYQVPSGPRTTEPVQIACWSQAGGSAWTSASGTRVQDRRSADTACPTAARRCRRCGSSSARDARRKNRWYPSPSTASQLSHTQWSGSRSTAPSCPVINRLTSRSRHRGTPDQLARHHPHLGGPTPAVDPLDEPPRGPLTHRVVRQRDRGEWRIGVVGDELLVVEADHGHVVGYRESLAGQAAVRTDG